MLDKKTFEENFLKFSGMKNKVKEDPNLLSFHIYPEAGWLNDPNGLCEYNGIYHIYYQYSPLDENKADTCWGHVSTEDFINYKREETFIYPDSKLDKDGAYSGSAFIRDGKINFFYTGNVKHDGKYDFIKEGREHNTIKLVSDGYKYYDKRLILDNDDYPKDMTKHVRDPKIYEKDGCFYMFIGARSLEDKGLVLVYRSKDLDNFTYHMKIETYYDFGYMWECPDFFTIDSKDFLILCPQGLASETYRFQNIYQAGYFPIEIDLSKKNYKLGEFAELDYGFDFYAPQTFEDSRSRRILIGRMGMPDADYTNPTIEYKWQHCLTIPRRLSVKNGKLCQNPISEMENLRKDNITLKRGENYEYFVFEALAKNIKESFKINLRSDVSLSYDDGILRLNMCDSSFGRDTRQVKINVISDLRIYSDKSSLEIFINEGEYVLTSRVYSKKAGFYSKDLDFDLYTLDSIGFI